MGTSTALLTMPDSTWMTDAAKRVQIDVRLKEAMVNGDLAKRVAELLFVKGAPVFGYWVPRPTNAWGKDLPKKPTHLYDMGLTPACFFYDLFVGEAVRKAAWYKSIPSPKHLTLVRCSSRGEKYPGSFPRVSPMQVLADRKNVYNKYEIRLCDENGDCVITLDFVSTPLDDPVYYDLLLRTPSRPDTEPKPVPVPPHLRQVMSEHDRCEWEREWERATRAALNLPLP